jgi:hypothetical protein
MPRSSPSTLPRVISLVLQDLSVSHEDLCVFLLRDIPSYNLQSVQSEYQTKYKRSDLLFALLSCHIARDLNLPRWSLALL